MTMSRTFARAARIAFAGPLWVGAVLLAFVGARTAGGYSRALLARGLDGHTEGALVLLAAWTCAVGAYLAVRLLGLLFARRAVGHERYHFRSPAAVIARVNIFDDTSWRTLGWSVALPMAGVSLLAPLTVHLLFASAFGAPAHGFDRWISYSLVLVGHAHVIVAGFAAAAAFNAALQGALGRPPKSWSRSERAHGPARALMFAVLASSFPGLAIFALPPLLTFFTGLFFVPAMFAWMHRVVDRESIS